MQKITSSTGTTMRHQSLHQSNYSGCWTLLRALSLALGSLIAAWVRYCTTSCTGSTCLTGSSSSLQWQFTWKATVSGRKYNWLETVQSAVAYPRSKDSRSYMINERLTNVSYVASTYADDIPTAFDGLSLSIAVHIRHLNDGRLTARRYCDNTFNGWNIAAFHTLQTQTEYKRKWEGFCVALNTYDRSFQRRVFPAIHWHVRSTETCTENYFPDNIFLKTFDIKNCHWTNTQEKDPWGKVR